MDTDKLIAKMRARVDQCRWLSQSIGDAHASAALRQMADEGEADIDRLLAEGGLESLAASHLVGRGEDGSHSDATH